MNTAPYTVPPQVTDYNTIGNELSGHGISWGYFGEGYNNGVVSSQYCGICDPMQYSSSIMTNPVLRKNTEHGLGDFLSEAAAGTLPAVSFLKPGDDDGHPGYSSLAAFESFLSTGDQRGAEQRRAVAVHRDLRHLRRGRRLLRLGLHPAGELLRRRPARADDRGLARTPGAAWWTTPTTTTCRS